MEKRKPSLNMFWRISVYILLFPSSIISVFCLCRICPRILECICPYCKDCDLGLDYIGVIVGLLSLLVTILIGWNIYSVLNIKSEWDRYKIKIERMNKRFDSKIESMENEFKKKQENFQNYGYAIIDFCQVYTKLGPDKTRFFRTYAKAMNALRNFLKTDEDLDCYASSCISNLDECLELAISQKEKCSNELEKTIQSYLHDIRTCSKVGFDAYWDRLMEVENKRKDYINGL